MAFLRTSWIVLLLFDEIPIATTLVSVLDIESPREGVIRRGWDNRT